jgi:hypothetical protein
LRRLLTETANGELTKLWKDGLESFSQGKYSQAKAKFEQLDKKYPDNYLVAKMIEVSSNTPDDSTESEASSAEAGTSESENNTTVIIVVVVKVTVLPPTGWHRRKNVVLLLRQLL